MMQDCFAMNSLISVIIPVYNTNQYLERCLDSIINNTYQNLEIICIDDGSSDNSLETLRRFEAADPRVIVIVKKNGGVSSARNAGLTVAHGDYITFVDSDDFVHPQYFEIMLSAQHKTNADIVTVGYQSVKEEELPVKFQFISTDSINPITLTRKAFFQKHQFRSYVWTKLYRRSVIRNVSFREEIRYGEDSVFVAEVCEGKKGVVFCYLPDKLYFYVDREGSLVHGVANETRYALAKIFAERALASSDNEEIYLEQAIRRLLSCRYITSYILLNPTIKKSCSTYLKHCMRRAQKTDLYSTKVMLAYQVFSSVPRTYWFYRSVTEPYMWKWERAERRKRKCK